MYLKSLSLKGFKSFADRTTLDFEPGVAVVVGPNGSGKSNVVDAVAWVLGAQAARTLRGGKMDDVIFAGTPRRPGSPKAEVTLTLDNSEGDIAIATPTVTITRTLTRDGESGYAINGEACRLLDIAELLSDTGVGRTQHVIVGQGRLDHILQARPEDRRSVIEEAAGVLKFRQRKEKAERRLEATAVNLDRVADLVKEVRRHLKPLERQADAARRHGGLAEELRAIKLHLSGREIAGLRSRLEALAQRQASLSAEEDTARQRSAQLETDVAEAERELSTLPADPLADAVGRAESLLARADGIVALLAEKQRGVDRSLAALADSGVVETLTAEAAQVRADLESVAAEELELEPAAAGITAAEADLAAQRRQLAEAPSADGTGEARRAADEARADLANVRSDQSRTAAELGRLQERHESVAIRVARLAEQARPGADEADDEEAGLAAALDAAREAVAGAEQAAEAADAGLRSAAADATGWEARADALAAALGALREQAAGSGCLDSVDGLLGPLVDVLDVEEGLETAVAVALGDAVRGLVAADVDAGRAALAALRDADADGLLVIGAGPQSSASAAAGPGFGDLPAGARYLAACVTSPEPALQTTLARLLRGAVVVEGGWEAAVALAVNRPDLVVVTRDGDRIDGRGAWRPGGRAVGATTAAVEEAERRAAAAAEARRVAERTLTDARTALAEARRWETAGDKALDSYRSRRTASDAARARAQAEWAEAVGEEEAIAEQVVDLTDRQLEEACLRAELEEALPALEQAEAEERRLEDERHAAVGDLQRAAERIATERQEHELRAAAVTERRRGLERRLRDVEDRLTRHGEARAQADHRRAALDRRRKAYAALAQAVAVNRQATAEAHERLRERRRERSEAARAAAVRLEQLRADRTSAERQATGAREQRAGVEVEQAQLRTRLDAAVEVVRRDLECEPEDTLDAPCPEIPEGITPAARAKEIERDLRQMGPINPLAMEEYTALQERHQLLEGQLEDVRAARRELTAVIKQVDEEIVERFTAAFNETEQHFGELIATLFPGGSGRLRLTEPADILNTGIEIEARPSGKNVRRLSLLSGGERSLTALAFLFAVFRARPSPFYILDEVEAALDDVNLCRLVDLIQAFREEAQLLVVSHQKRTMEAADCLYGVSMSPGGSSIVVTQKVPEMAIAARNST